MTSLLDFDSEVEVILPGGEGGVLDIVDWKTGLKRSERNLADHLLAGFDIPTALRMSKVEPSKANIMRARAALKRPRVVQYMQERLPQIGFSDEHIMAKHSYLIHQMVDLAVAKGAIDSYYKLTGQFQDTPQAPVNINILKQYFESGDEKPREII